METIFRKVLCSDTNPKNTIDSAIITNKGLLWWNGLNWHDRQSRIVINPEW